MENGDHNTGRRIRWVRGAIVVCLILIAFIVGSNHRRNQDASLNGLPPGVVVNGATYIISGWDIAAVSLPDGFTKGGIVEITTVSGRHFSDCKYYVNAAVPEWVYVLGPIHDEQSDAVYRRFVLPDIRYNTFIRYDDHIYVQLFGYTDDGEDQKAFYRYKSGLEERYGYRIEGTVPGGCALVGSAQFEELDRIPRTELGVNHRDYQGADVYANPEDSGVLYVGTEWHTATAEEAGDTLHNGYDVFVLYEPGEAY